MSYVCVGTLSVVGFGYVAAIKVILILRLRAIYGYHRKVSILLYALIAEGLVSKGGLAALTGVLVLATASLVQTHFPLPGCWLLTSTLSWSPLVGAKTLLAFWIIRFSATTIETVLMLIKLTETLNAERRFSDESLWSVIREHRRLTPVLYIFYRDGALLIIPTLGLIGDAIPSSAASGVDWNMWLLLTYQLFGSRLILNIRRVNGKLTKSIIPEHLSTIRFASDSHIDR
ncbi:hypothetical protein NP233_g11193 [Leucocoprinus birnbaumii]|uniref:Uncharacterized protein n=1 Tax=Leucocoprinus birnbaumii TaxID=56174 RepID=A0AAD5VJC2_9AGAR|nr:hypothetical protein NP233_g11193 [Leucocoprinus birnbaumii]